MFRKIQKFWLQRRLRVSQYNIEYYHYWFQRLGADMSSSQGSPSITLADLEAEWRTFADSYLLFRVFAQDSLSLFSQAFSSEFDTPEKTIEVGRFAKGASMKITTHGGGRRRP